MQVYLPFGYQLTGGGMRLVGLPTTTSASTSTTISLGPSPATITIATNRSSQRAMQRPTMPTYHR